ncbi:MAG TPA: CBS domain-containing protein [Streptosporangiaceae bacterium]|nr:CBS domain-containing protein [Streptosporangiaceae bacterium]
MTGGQIFTSRLNGRPLLDSAALTIGRIRDVVILPVVGNDPPRALGLVVTLQRRRIFVNLGQVAEISVDGAHLHDDALHLDRFTRRTGEILASELYGRHVKDGTIVDVAISPDVQRRVGWEVSALAVSYGRSLLHRGPTVVSWDRHPELFETGPLAEQLAGLRELKPADLATAVQRMPPGRRSQIAAALDNQQLADLLEEMPEHDQVRLLAGLGLERSADVVEEMQPDDAADLLAAMSAEQREHLLTAMESVQAADLRRLLRYSATTAGGLMTSRPIIVTPETPVAEVLARIMQPDLPATAAAQVYVCEPPMVTPTGRYLGSVGFQRLLRRPPSDLVGQCVDKASVFVRPDLGERDLAARLAAYNLMSVAVCDEDGRLLGAVTVDDVLDHLLPPGWRETGG